MFQPTHRILYQFQIHSSSLTGIVCAWTLLVIISFTEIFSIYFEFVFINIFIRWRNMFKFHFKHTCLSFIQIYLINGMNNKCIFCQPTPGKIWKYAPDQYALFWQYRMLITAVECVLFLPRAANRSIFQPFLPQSSQNLEDYL